MQEGVQIVEIIRDIEQGTDEWKQLRLGLITASRFSDVLAKGRGGAPSKTRNSYMLQLAAEILTGEPQDSFKNEYMEWGNQTEPQARAMYELDSGNTVEQVSFVRSQWRRVGISPDGLVGDKGGLEIKCPKTTTQIETYLRGEMPPCHKAQVQGSMWIAERDWWDFVSFDPRINGEASYFCVRVERDEDYIKDLSEKCYEFEKELEHLIEKLR